jgi:SAM-dependent methyltransferase
MSDETTSDLVERQRQHFNSIAGRYQTGRKDENHLYLKKLMWGDALAPVTRFRGRHVDVLEPMCGFCDGLGIIKSYITDDVSYSGYDYSDTVIASVGKSEPALNIWQADATTYHPPTGAFDIIILIGSLHHTPNNAAEIIANCSRGLRPNGIFISFEATDGNILFRRAREAIYRRNTFFDEATERAFRAADLIAMFRAANLRPLSISYPGLLSYVLYYNPDAFPFLNIGGRRLVKAIYSFDKLFYKTPIGCFFSFATLSIWERSSPT